MATAEFGSGWIPEEYDSNVITRVHKMSAVEAYGRHYPMAHDTRHVPRSAGMDVEGVAKGGARERFFSPHGICPACAFSEEVEKCGMPEHGVRRWAPPPGSGFWSVC